MSGGDSDTPNVHDSQGNPQRTINQGCYDEARKSNEARKRTLVRTRHCAYFSNEKSKNMHIFRKARGHFEKDSKDNRALILSAVTEENYVGKDRFNKEYFYKTINVGKYSGQQVWVYVRNCIIVDAGINSPPLSKSEIMKNIKMRRAKK